MNMRKYWNLALPLAFLGLALGTTACKEDEASADEQTRQELLELDPFGKSSDEGVRFWGIISQLCGDDEMPDEWRTMRFSPKMGFADELDPYTRVVVASDLATAAQRFANLTEAPVDAATTDYEWTDPLVGTLKYHAGSPTDNYLAKVEVNIPQMPTLKKLLYRTHAQAGTNAEFTGTAYYRFGDVVQKAGDLWICVRPPFGPDGIEESLWVTLSPLSGKYIKEVHYHGYYWRLFQNLGKHKEEMEDFAEFVYALQHPAEFFKNLSANAGLRFFHDMNPKHISMNNQWFFASVGKAWRQQGLFQKLFYNTDGILEENGLNLFYNTWGTEFNLPPDYKFYLANYSGPNWKTARYTTVKKNMMTTGIDFLDYSTKGTGKASPGRAYVIRCAKGSELTTGRYHYKTPLAGCTEVYVYNKYFYPQGLSLNTDPEVATEAMYNAR